MMNKMVVLENVYKTNTTAEWNDGNDEEEEEKSSVGIATILQLLLMKTEKKDTKTKQQ